MIEKKEFPLIQVNGQTDVIVMDSDSKPVGAFSGLTAQVAAINVEEIGISG
uniref:Uncharacterized protein n=1 Tax=Tetranychus urticae TaxID=32264 RepID=T1L588_TETUR